MQESSRRVGARESDFGSRGFTISGISSLTPIVFFALFLFWWGQDSITAQPREQLGEKRIHAIRANPHSPKLDGRLDDEIWQQADWRSDFLQRVPDEGALPSGRTEVAVVFDDVALYVGARLYCDNAAKLRMHLERRDNQGPAEQFIVSIDSYFDRRTGYGFGVNTSGVRFDRYYPQDQEGGADYSWNPVWQAATSRDDHGWYVEMRIPFSQLRFNDLPEQIWGINFNRYIPEKNEDTYWIYTPRNEAGFISRFGVLTGISGIKPSRRIELLPYFAGDLRFTDGDFTKNPFRDGRETQPRIGADLKVGLGPALTLDAAFNPDFGQVEADPAEVNLTAFETFFSERRPFFNEGAQLLRGIGPNYFYSRRIGAAPHDFGTGDVVDQPSSSTILGAAKVTGKLGARTSVGILSALTQAEYARNYIIDSDSTYKSQVEPLTFYGVTRVERQFGRDQSTAGLLLTGVVRDLGGAERLEQRLRKEAITGGGDWRLRFQNGIYQFSGYAGFSYVGGSAAAIAQTQRSSVRYFQRPDADYVTYDSTRTSLAGYTASLEFGKRGGRHWLWGIGGSAESPGFELNDAGILSQADDLNLYANLIFRENKPGAIFRSYYSEVFTYGNWNYGGSRNYSEVGYYTEVTWKNYWGSWFRLAHQITGQDNGRTRGGPSMQNEAGYSFGAGFWSNYTRTTRFSSSFNYGIDELDGWLWKTSTSLSTRIGTRMAVSIAPQFVREEQPRQYVARVADAGGGEGTYGARYIFSRIARNTGRLELRLDYYLTPDLSLELYAEPFAANGRYFGHGELVAARGHDLRIYGESEGTSIELREEEGRRYYLVKDNGTEFHLPYRDFGSRSFRSNVVMRWEFRPGSTLYLVWQRNLSEQREIGRSVRPASLFDAIDASGIDFVAIKVAYWLPVS